MSDAETRLKPTENGETRTLHVDDDVVFDQEIYPREEVDEDNVEVLQSSDDELPPITVTTDGALLDGYHRVRATKMAGEADIEANVVEVDGGKAEQLLEAARYNSRHGKPLSKDERRKVAREIFKNGDVQNKEVAEALGMSAGWVSNATDDLAKKNREERRDLAYSMYLNYNEYSSQKAVAEDLGVTRQTVQNDNAKKFNSEDICVSSATDDDEPPDWVKVDNSWSFSKCSPSFGTKWPGRIPGQIIKNLVYYYTESKDLVLDPMAGGGTTVDVCTAMARRYAAYDINPLEDKNIVKADVTDGIPLDDNTADFAFFDPPYWNLMDEDYAEGGISELSLDEWYDEMESILRDLKRATKTGGHIALLIEPFFDREAEEFQDLTVECMLRARQMGGLEQVQRVMIPLSHGSVAVHDVQHVKEEGRMLDLNRDLVIWTVEGGE